jgi:hypothetical protein
MTAHCKPAEAATSEMVRRLGFVIRQGRTDNLTSEQIARVVIEAMREPTEAMIDAGGHDDYDPRWVWQIMIDEALQ